MLGVCSRSVGSAFQRPGRFQRESRVSESHQGARTSMCKAGGEAESNQNHGRICARVFVMPLNVLSSLPSLDTMPGTSPEVQLLCCQLRLRDTCTMEITGQFQKYISTTFTHGFFFFRVLERK